jgi:tetratricopeptide (TPR) repeat protein
MRIQLRRWLPSVVFCWALCVAGYGILATGPVAFGQDAETDTDDAPPEPTDFDALGEVNAPTDFETPDESEPLEETPDPEPDEADVPADEGTAEPDSAQTSEEPIDDDPQAAVPLDATPAEDEPEAPQALEPASLEGVRVGSTTRQQLHEQWGKPLETERIAGGSRESFHVKKFGPVRATVTGDVVTALAVHVEHPLALAVVEERLKIDDVEPATVYDDAGELLGAAYPPRGVLLGYVPETRPPRVFQIIVEPINAPAYLARAEVRLATRYGDCLADVDKALELEPASGHAHQLRAEIAFRSGDLETALTAAKTAIELEPHNLKHPLLVARVLAISGDYPQAIRQVRAVIDNPEVPDVVVARAWCLWGDYLARSSERDYARAIKHHQQAIRLAEPLARHDQYVVRRAAKEILVDAHLAVAYDIAWGRWREKSQVVPRWLDRAAAFADELLANEHGDADVYIRVYSGALAALAGIAEPPDASKWIRGIQQHGMRMYDEATDPAYRAQLAWELATSLTHAVEVQAGRHQADESLAMAEIAQTLFDESSPVAGRLPIYNYQRGRLCFLTGAVHSIERGDHTNAVAWFDRAAPLLEKPVPATAIDAGTQGEAFVSMAVSYWEEDLRREALRLTRQGLQLMEKAVGDGVLDTASLAIPYSNLASMHEALSEFDEAKKCAELAARYQSEVETK